LRQLKLLTYFSFNIRHFRLNYIHVPAILLNTVKRLSSVNRLTMHIPIGDR